ncbi:MAG: hypothetical protein D6705_00850 [Deltaproteobacteria bacterium]|nr:MAG: hypothetical protein D6705_00850 [Deltaproteobacteria bacterium]
MRRRLGWALAWGLFVPACTSESEALRLDVVDVELSAVGAEARAYVRRCAEDLARARASADPSEREALALAVLERPVPSGVEGAELLRLEAAEMLCETWDSDAAGARRAVALVGPMLAPRRRLPLDPISARALVCLGDAADRAGDTDLAATSYLRAIRLMQMLQEEAMP